MALLSVKYYRLQNFLTFWLFICLLISALFLWIEQIHSFLSPLGTHIISQHLTGPQVIIEKEVNPKFSLIWIQRPNRFISLLKVKKPSYLFVFKKTSSWDSILILQQACMLNFNKNRIYHKTVTNPRKITPNDRKF